MDGVVDCLIRDCDRGGKCDKIFFCELLIVLFIFFIFLVIFVIFVVVVFCLLDFVLLFWVVDKECFLFWLWIFLFESFNVIGYCVVECVGWFCDLCGLNCWFGCGEDIDGVYRDFLFCIWDVIFNFWLKLWLFCVVDFCIILVFVFFFL